MRSGNINMGVNVSRSSVYVGVHEEAADSRKMLVGCVAERHTHTYSTSGSLIVVESNPFGMRTGCFLLQ